MSFNSSITHTVALSNQTISLTLFLSEIQVSLSHAFLESLQCRLREYSAVKSLDTPTESAIEQYRSLNIFYV